jgi:hypothetical protein
MTSQHTDILLTPFLKYDPLPKLSILDTFMERLEPLGLEESVVNAWLHQYGVHYVDEKIKLMENRNKDIWDAKDFLRKAITQNWTSKTNEQLGKTIFPSHEENVIWYKSLSDKEKMEQYHKAIYKQDTFSLHLEIKKISYLDNDFHESTFFKYMMSLLGRFP